MAYDPGTTPVDFVIMAGVNTPGIASVQRAKREIKVDEIGGYGASGAVLVVHGKRPVAFDVVITLLTRQDWDDWDTFKSVVLTLPTGPKAEALQVWHPWLQMLDVSACIVNGVSQPEDDGTGGFTITLSCTEYRKPRQDLGSPKQAKGAPEPTPDPVDQKIGLLTGAAQLRSLGLDGSPLEAAADAIPFP